MPVPEEVDAHSGKSVSAVGFEPTRIAPPELESGALDRSAKLSREHSQVQNSYYRLAVPTPQLPDP